MEECSVLIESTLPAEDKTSRWFNLPIDYELFRDLLGVEADSGDYQIIDMKLPFAGDIVRTTSVRRLNKLYFAYMELPPEVQQAYNDLISYCGGVEDLLQKSEEFRFYPECHNIMDVARYRLEHNIEFSFGGGCFLYANGHLMIVVFHNPVFSPDLFPCPAE